MSLCKTVLNFDEICSHRVWMSHTSLLLRLVVVIGTDVVAIGTDVVIDAKPS